MILTSEKAYELLMGANEKAPGGYVNHSLKVGEAAARIADALGLDSEKARAMGYIHDIGKIYGMPFTQHVARGYEYLKELGYDDEYANVCITHSYLNNDITCTAAGVVKDDTYKYNFRKEFVKKHKYTMYEEIICLCDLMCTHKFLLLEERLVEILARRGGGKNTQYHVQEALKLREKINMKLGKEVNLLFPEIIERLTTSNNTKEKENDRFTYTYKAK